MTLKQFLKLLKMVKEWDGHVDYIRCLAVHPSLPYVLSSSDDMNIKLWDWDKNWMLNKTFEGHNHYIMQIVFNPKDPSTFATASLDKTVKVWGLSSSSQFFTLEGHDKGVNCVAYYPRPDKSLIISGSDDQTVKVWDYQNKSCVQTLTGHSHNISCLSFHNNLPIILSGSEDGTVKLWHTSTYRLESTLNYGLERVWCIGVLEGKNIVGIGYDNGCIVISLGSEKPLASMDHLGKLVFAKNNGFFSSNIKSLDNDNLIDGEPINLTLKELGSIEVYPQMIKHSPNSRFVAVQGDGEYTIYTALAWRNKSFGNALEFAWSSESSMYMIRDMSGRVVIYKSFKEVNSFKPSFHVEGIFGGDLFGVKGSSFVCIYDWEKCRLVRKIDIDPKILVWSQSGSYLAIIGDKSTYILEYDSKTVSKTFENGIDTGIEGIKDSFKVKGEINEAIISGVWIGDCFLYVSGINRLNYYVGGEIVIVAHLDGPLHLLGYISNYDKVYLVDKEMRLRTFKLESGILEYQSAIARKDFNTANSLIQTVPVEARNRIARFLESQGLLEEALQVTTDPDHKFDLAIQLEKMDVAVKVAEENDKTNQNVGKWNQLSDLALKIHNYELLETCLIKAKDYSGLYLHYTSMNNMEKIISLGNITEAAGQHNIAFLCYFLGKKIDSCIDLLLSIGKEAEAALFTRTYRPSRLQEIVMKWKESLSKKNPKAAAALATPKEYPNLFSELNREETKELESLSDKFNQSLRYASSYDVWKQANSSPNRLEFLLEHLNIERKVESPISEEEREEEREEEKEQEKEEKGGDEGKSEEEFLDAMD